MIYYLVSKDHSYTINNYLTSWGKALSFQIAPFHYEQLFQAKLLQIGTYIFSDIERLAPQQAERASQIWTTLKKAGQEDCQSLDPKLVHLLNHPTFSMRRYELLRILYELRLNEFNIYRLTECRMPQHFPVFIRGENDHAGSLTPLIKTSEELELVIKRIINQGRSRENKVIIEFCNTSDEKGIFRKYSVMKVGNRIIPRHLFFSRNWQVKQPDLIDKELLLEEQCYIENNPHEAQLKEIFELARIDYGRIDYSLLCGKIQVWEINTNPMTLWEIDRNCKSVHANRLLIHERFAQQLHSAFTALNYKTDSINCSAFNWQTLE